jgi:type VII secretion-associated serine protease mycosin
VIGRAALAVATVLALLAATASPAAADQARDLQWQLSDLNMTKVHRITQGAGVVVAVVDTGVDAGHRDLAGAVLPGTDLLTYRAGDGTGRGDLDGHGTQMAGFIAGRGHGAGHGDGILGIAPAAKILPIRSPVTVGGTSEFVKDAVAFAVARHAGVVNMSFGTVDSEAMREAIKAARAADIVLVAAIGNRGSGAPGELYPGKYPEVLCVGSYGRNHRASSFSVTGPQLDLLAPGDRAATTNIGRPGYGLGRGSSASAAIVSGAAALLRAKFPRLSAAEVVHRLTATAIDGGAPGRDDSYGYGRLNLLAALTADVPARPPTAAPTPSAVDTPTAAVPAVPAVDSSALPEPLNPVVPAAVAAALVLLVGAIVVTVMIRRRRSPDSRRP